jgi:hypothetical protein
MTDDIFDFGFTAVDQEELDIFQEKQAEIQTVSQTATQYEARLDKLYNAIQPLLNNLKKNPEKDFILWPDRLSKIEAFETILNNIYEGN